MLGLEQGSRLDHLEVRACLEARGWVLVPSRRPYAAVYRIGREPLMELQVPLDYSLVDYDEAMSVVVQRLATYERRPVEAIVEDLLLLRPTRESQHDQFVGQVVELMGEPGELGEVEGAVVLLVQVDDELLKTRVVLGPGDYRKAAAAHLAQRYVTVSGVLRRGPRVHWIEKASGFEVLGVPPTGPS